MVTDKHMKEYSDSINSLIVYHGTPKELDLPIVAKSSPTNDFGSGFYTSILPDFAQSISIRDGTNGIVYQLFYTGNFKIYNFKDNFEFWYLYTAANRGIIDINKYPKLQDKVNGLNAYDIIIGLISDDRSQYAFNQYFDEAITDACLIECLKYFKLGCQVVFKTQKACDKIKVLAVHRNSGLDVKEIEHAKKIRIGTAQDIVHELKVKYRDVGNRVYNVLERYK